MNLIYFALFSIFILTLLVVFEKKVGANAIFLFGIGSIINGSIFHLYNFPINSFNVVFGMDFLLQPIFFWCLYFMLKKQNSQGAKSMLIVSALSLLFSASIQFLTSCLSNNYSDIYLNEFIGFLFNIIAYLISGFVLICALSKVNKNNLKLLLILFLTNSLNFVLFYFSRLVVFDLVNWKSFAIFFAFNIMLNILFLIFVNVISSKKEAEVFYIEE